MSLGENSLVAAYQGKGQLKSRPSGTRVVTPILSYQSVNQSINQSIIHLIYESCRQRRNWLQVLTIVAWQSRVHINIYLFKHK